MPLTQVENSPPGYTSLNGVTPDNQPLVLGRDGLTARIGRHIVGADGAYGSVVKIVAVYDPSIAAQEADEERNLQASEYIGHIQFVQISFQGKPIPPDVFGGAFATYARYMPSEPYDDECEFVDFMNPANVYRYLVADPDSVGDSPVKPFYAVNSVLTQQIANLDALKGNLLRNGCLRKVQRYAEQANTRAAVLRAAISIEQLNPQKIRQSLDQETLLCAPSLTPADFALKSLPQLAFEALQRQRSEGASIPEISQADITRARQVGEFALLSVANDENEEPVLCVFRQDDSLHVHLISWEQMEQMERWETEALLTRIDQYIKENYHQFDDQTPSSGRGRGGGLANYAFPHLNGPCLNIRLRTAVYGVPIHEVRNIRHGLLPLSAIEWNLRWNFDSLTRRFESPSFTLPQIVPAEMKSLQYPLDAYFTAIQTNSDAEEEVDTSNFLLADLLAMNFGDRDDNGPDHMDVD
jgi:hypothetical protein